MNVLSLFDGMSCGQLALDRAGIEYNNYFASEINEEAMSVAMHNYPDTIQIGNVLNVDGTQLGEIDLLIGGSPCQGFSVAGKQLNFDDPRSKLFFEFVRILKEVKPKYFMLENVRMKKEFQDIISEILGVQPININSRLMSAQLRNRFYWTNIPNVGMPEDKNICLEDIIESGYVDREKSRAILESESRPLRNKANMIRRYRKTGFTTLVFDDAKLSDENCRYFTQIELERLQTVPVGYTEILKRDRAASLLGNGWTVDVISHIFKNMEL